MTYSAFNVYTFLYQYVCFYNSYCIWFAFLQLTDAFMWKQLAVLSDCDAGTLTRFICVFVFIRCWSAAYVKMCFHCKVIKYRGCCYVDTPCVMTVWPDCLFMAGRCVARLTDRSLSWVSLVLIIIRLIFHIYFYSAIHDSLGMCDNSHAIYHASL